MRQGYIFSEHKVESSGTPEHGRHRNASVLVGKRVVIVEDEGITQLQLRRVLRIAGMIVVGAATSGPEATEIVLKEKPDLVLMDIRMPGEYDGLEAARRILEVFQTCIVMLTAFSDPETREVAHEIGTCGYINKPVDQESLIPLLESAMEDFSNRRRS